MNPFPYKRVVVVGTTSSGKSTIAKRLADEFGLDFIELDALYWAPNWIDAALKFFVHEWTKRHTPNVGPWQEITVQYAI